MGYVLGDGTYAPARSNDTQGSRDLHVPFPPGSASDGSDRVRSLNTLAYYQRILDSNRSEGFDLISSKTLPLKH